MRVSVYCGACLARLPLPDPAGDEAGSIGCANAHEPVSYAHSESVRAGRRVDACSRCGATAFFVQRDFDQRVGCAILAGGAALALVVSWRFGGVWFVPVLLAFAAADLVVARRVGAVVICYRCDTEYRDVPEPGTYKPYDPHVAERHAELKTVRRMNP